jgi:hypothetical protein
MDEVQNPSKFCALSSSLKKIGKSYRRNITKGGYQYCVQYFNWIHTPPPTPKKENLNNYSINLIPR